MDIASEIVKALDDSQLEALGKGVVKELLKRGLVRNAEDCNCCDEPSIKKRC